MPHELLSLEDQMAIQRLNYRYAYFVDTLQIEKWLECFTNDAFFDEREFDSGLHIGQDAIRKYGLELVANVIHAIHHMTNHLVTGGPSNCATGIAFSIVEGMTRSSGHARYHVIYEDEYTKDEDGWKIKKRVLRKTFPTEILSHT